MIKTRILFVSVLILVTAQSIFSQNNLKNFLKEPYLIFNNDERGIRVLWQLEKYNNATIYLTQGELGVNDSFYVKEINNEHQFQFDFKNLVPNKKYFYRIRTQNYTKGGSFYSRADSNVNDFTFYAYGDTRTFPEKHNEVANQIMLNIASDPKSQTFIVSTGDLVANGDLEDDWDEQFFSNQYHGIRNLLANMPYMVSVGNHEGQGLLFEKYFSYDYVSENSLYYSFNYANVHFIALDQFDDLDSKSKQYIWFVDDLKNSKSNWNIVLLHKPGWTSGGHKNNKNVQKVLQPLFEKYNVKLVLTGHNHYYARAMVNGVCHITTGGGGAPLYNPKKPKNEVVVVDKSLHFCKIHSTEKQLSIKAIRVDGSMIETYTIEKN